jgi:photosystem II stability/assembly factor-like uncharacterized protein
MNRPLSSVVTSLAFAVICLCAPLPAALGQVAHTSAYAANPFIQEMVDAVSRDSLASCISALQAFGTRYEYTPQRDSAGAYLLRKFEAHGLSAHSDWYAFGTTVLYDLEIVSADSIWVIGSSGTLVSTTDAGSTWRAPSIPVRPSFYGLDFSGRSNGWVVGSAGTILRTTDGGVNWTQQTSPVISVLYDVGFADNRLGIAVGSGGAIVRTSDGGGIWAKEVSGTGASFRRLAVIDSSHAWAVGDSGKILFSNDGGKSWLPQVSGTTSPLYGLDFVSVATGWAVGNGPTILKTTDGGASWSQITPPPQSGSSWRSISFRDSLIGWAASLTGDIFSTSDGGKNWSPRYNHLNLGWGPSIYAVQAHPGGEILCCGSQGALSRSQNGGGLWTYLTGNLPADFLRTSRNIIATIPGKKFPERECIIIAHYDSYSDNPSVSAPGANDNATGTSAVMEAARACRLYTFESTVKFIAVSAEEMGMYGSTNYARRARDGGTEIAAVVNGDMIGYPTVGDTTRIAIGSFMSRNRLVDSSLTYNTRYGIGLTLVPFIDQTGASDYGPFAKAGYDALDVAEGTAPEIWGGADPYYHKATDTIDKLNLGMIRRAAQLMLATVAGLAVPMGRVSSVPPADARPERHALFQNYPNPFNPNSDIRYQISEFRMVRLAVYDLLGREVAVLVNEPKAPGSYQVRFDATGLPSGVYFYRLQVRPSDPATGGTGSYTETKRMILVR